MKAVMLTARDGTIVETELGSVRYTSVATVRAALAMYASRFIGGKEGEDWSIIQAFDRRLVPFFVRAADRSVACTEIHVQ